jgi:MATE family multidrug resistance protein
MSHASRRRRRLFFHEVRELARIAGPIVVAQLGGIAMNTTDTIMVGGLGAIALAAAGIATAVQFAMIVVCNGVIMGMSPLVSQAFGAGDREECRRVLVQGCGWRLCWPSLGRSSRCLAGGCRSCWARRRRWRCWRATT